MSDWIGEIERLSQLKSSGALSDAEFEAAKAQVLAAKEGASARSDKVPSPDAVKPLKGTALSASKTATSHSAHAHATWGQFLNSNELDAILVASSAYYKRIFKKIIDKTGYAEKPISNSGDILASASFNIAPMFLGGVWASFRGIAGWQMITIGIAIWNILSSFFPTSADLAVMVAIGVVMVIYGNSWYLKALANKWAAGAPAKGINGYEPSFARVGIFVLAMVLSVLISIWIEDGRSSEAQSSEDFTTRYEQY